VHKREASEQVFAQGANLDGQKKAKKKFKKGAPVEKYEYFFSKDSHQSLILLGIGAWGVLGEIRD